MIFPRIRFIYLCAAVLFAAGCGGNYNKRMAPVKSGIAAGEYKKALNSYAKTGLNEEEKSKLLYHLEAGILYHLAGDYKQSNYFLERAEWLADELYTKSLAGEAAALMTSDATLSYRGEYYDYLYTNYYKLLNYLSLGEFEDALVEVRRINHKLSLFDKASEPFLHFITALLYDYDEQKSSAFIEYKKAYQTYKEKPESLLESIGRFWGRTDFVRMPEIAGSRIKKLRTPVDYGTVIFISETGFVPHKTEKSVEAAIPQKLRKKHSRTLQDVYYLTIAMPEYSPPEEQIEQVTLHLNGEADRLDLGSDISATVLEHFENEQPKILARAVARAVTKYVAYRSVKGDGGDEDGGSLRNLLGTSVNILGAATEQADTRSWLTLPGKIFLTRKDLPAGDYSFNMEYHSNRGRKETSGEMEFSLSPGELKFVVIRK
ncbi:MAG: hypothetical protein U9R36_04450 [Elusimicrobiota bacterium]|nr:hypothetical protein [Elusimicrobiota bacterium]